jgi:hypothetical protein
MLIFYAPTKIEYFFLRIFAVFGLSVHVFDKNKVLGKNQNSGFDNIHKVDLQSEDKIGLSKFINYRDKKRIKQYLSSLQLDEIYSKISKRFQGIDLLEQKLNLSLISTLEFYVAGMVYAYYISKRKRKSERLFIINFDFKSFIIHDYNVFDKTCFHIGLPLGQSLLALYGLVSSGLHRVLRSQYNAKVSAPKIHKDLNLGHDVAIFFHQSDSYGSLYRKSHYFSQKIGSLLNWNTIDKYALFPNKDTPGHLAPLQVRISRFELLKFFNFVNPLVFLRSSISSKRAQIILFYRYLEYQGWLRVLGEPKFKNVIIDYDILFPKPLSLALERLNVKTFALQERPSLSMYHMTNGVICDVYLYAGDLWRSYGEKNKSIICRNVFSCSSWRNIFFFPSALKIEDMEFHAKPPNNSLKKKIVFFGYFFDPDSLATNAAANKQLLKYVSDVAENYPDCSVFLRMKALDEGFYQVMLKQFVNTPNVFISTQYDIDGLSYILCRDADVVVSVQTSLAEEALAFGKSVILIDNLYSVNGMCSNIYPDSFDFLTARCSKDMINLIGKVFSTNHQLLLRYRNLKKLLSGRYVFTKKSDISTMIEGLIKGGPTS